MKRLLIIGLLLMAGCAELLWVQTKGPQSMEKINFSVDLPEGWMRMNKEEFLLITRDGTALQAITIDRTSIAAPLKHTKKNLAKGMLPQEVAETVIDNISSNKAVQNFELRENSPATIGGQQGFKLVYSYRPSGGLKKKVIVYGFLAGEWFYEFRYSAAERYYFEKDLEIFNKFMASFRLLKP